MVSIIDLMRCKNCINYCNGICKEKKGSIIPSTDCQIHYHTGEVNREDKCSLWTEDTAKTEAEETRLNRIYYQIIDVFKNYCDLKEEYYPVISLWVIGTYIHKQFPTYPYLFFNAMRGSGKSRILNLIATLSYNGKLVSNMTEAVLFRTASNRTICIDEFEEIGTKEKNTLRELLNSAYKRGMSVERVIKKKGKEKEEYVVESFDVYCPIVMANINGVEDVLSDRCITLVLEKSANRKITRLIELFEKDYLISEIIKEISVGNGVSDGLETLKGWNTYLLSDRLEGVYTTDTHNTHNTNNITDIFFSKIIKTSLEGRDLELFFPLFILAEKCGVLDKFIPIAEELVKSKKQEDFVESRDIAFLHFLSKRKLEGLFTPIKSLVREFAETEEEAEWVTAEWIGRALKRLGLIIEKRRLSAGREVVINYNKVNEKLRIFK